MSPGCLATAALSQHPARSAAPTCKDDLYGCACFSTLYAYPRPSPAYKTSMSRNFAIAKLVRTSTPCEKHGHAAKHDTVMQRNMTTCTPFLLQRYMTACTPLLLQRHMTACTPLLLKRNMTTCTPLLLQQKVIHRPLPCGFWVHSFVYSGCCSCVSSSLYFLSRDP
jgi:hypothetical protein